MKITIKERGSKSFYDEFLYVCYFIKKFLKKPFTKVNKMTNYLILNLIITSAVTILEIIYYSYYRDNLILFVIGFLSLLILYLLFYLFRVYKRIEEFRNVKKEVILSIEEKGIIYESEDINVVLKWDNIKNIIVGKHAIVFLPVSQEHMLITIAIEYLEEVKKKKKKYKKLELLINRDGTNNG